MRVFLVEFEMSYGDAWAIVVAKDEEAARELLAEDECHRKVARLEEIDTEQPSVETLVSNWPMD